MRYAVIIAGGSGTRLWPMSTSRQPKQLIPFMHGKTLLQLAAERIDGLVAPENRFICTGESMRKSIHEAMPDFPQGQILGEPVGRDTLNAVGFSAAAIHASDPDAIIAVFTADHLIEPLDVFRERVEIGFKIVEEFPQTLVTFGIKPTFPATAYGYVHLGEPLKGYEHTRQASAFKEKPDEPTAKEYLEAGDYLWNSGMFVWRAETLLDLIKRFKPENYEGLMKIAKDWGTSRAEATLAVVYPRLPKISVDYAIMEPASTDSEVRIATVEMPLRWLDVGSWPSYAQTVEADPDGNRSEAAKSITAQSKNNLIVSSDPNHVIATLGVEDLVVVHTPNATLICKKEMAEKIKDFQAQVGKQFGEEYV